MVFFSSCSARTTSVFLLFLFSSVLYAQDYSNQWNALNCNFDDLPSNLNSVAYLSLNQETKLFGEYFVNMTDIVDELNFTLSTPSYFRIYVAPHAADVDLWLYNDTGYAIAHSSLAVRTDEAIGMFLQPGSYTVLFNYFGSLVGNYDPTECDTLVMELAITPKSLFDSRSALLPSACSTQQEQLPQFDFSPLADMQSVTYHSDSLLVFGDAVQDNIFAYRWIQSWSFEIPREKGISETLWKFDANLGTDFLRGASLGFVLAPTRVNDTAPWAPHCFNCTVAVSLQQNKRYIREILPPGNYTLWLYDSTGTRAVSGCTPFSFSLNLTTELVPENILNCEALNLPDQLIPGFDTPRGYLHYSESVLVNLNENGDSTSFIVQYPSWIRVWVAPHRIDIDLQLLDESGRVIAYGFNLRGEEIIALYVDAAQNYTLNIIFYGAYEHQFCETYDIEIAVIPVGYAEGQDFNSPGPEFDWCYTDSSHSSIRNQPIDLSPMAAATAAALPYRLPLTTGFALNNITTGNSIARRRLLLQQNFTVVVPTSVKAILGDAFVWYSLNLQIHSYNDSSRRATDDRGRNVHRLIASLPPGNYAFEILVGAVQAGANLTMFPPCAEYSLELEFIPTSQQTDQCLSVARVPTTLNSIQFLGHSKVVHFEGEFLAPVGLPGTSSRTEWTNFTVVDQSYFRLWTSPHHIDIDLFLYENDTVIVARSVRYNSEEELLWTLSPGLRYSIKYVYYHWTHIDPRYRDPTCQAFRMELAIVPALVPLGSACRAVLPDSSFMPSSFDANSAYFFNRTRYSFTQSSTPLSNASLTFTVTSGFVYFRAIVDYDFVWSDLALTLRMPDGSSEYPINGYSREDTHSLLLTPGTYVLRISEVKAQLQQYRRCVTFTLSVAIQGVSTPEQPNQKSVLGCDALPVPAHLTSHAYLQPYSGNRIHWQRQFLADVSPERRDVMLFDVTVAPTLVRVFIPYHRLIDIDVYLRFAANSTRLDYSNGYTDEAIWYVIPAPGSYAIDFRFFAFMGVSFPTASECVAFPMELEISPLSYYLDSTWVTSPQCVSQSPQLPSTLTLDQPYPVTVYGAPVSPTTNPLLATMSFTVSTGEAVLDLDLRYQFGVGPLSVVLNGLVQTASSNTPTPRTHYAHYGLNHAYLHLPLPTGSYNVTVRNIYGNTPPDGSAATGFLCSRFELSYLISTNVSVPICDEDELPTDLYSEAGGSRAFGGPQFSDSTVRIVGEFLLDDSDGKDNYILFFANGTNPIYMRVYAGDSSANHDVDFFVFANATGPSDLRYYAIGSTNTESAVWKLTPQPNPWALNVYLYEIDRTDPCPTMQFALALRPEPRLRQELLCPSPLPNPEVPPGYFRLASTQFVSGSNYVFTRQRIDANTRNNAFTYRIQLDVVANTTLLAVISYEFVANDFHFHLIDSSKPNEILSEGQGAPLSVRQSYYNFVHVLHHYIEKPGTYYLDIRDTSLANKPFPASIVNCHHFSFYLAAITMNSDSGATVESVQPPSAQNLDPARDLLLTVSLTESAVVAFSNFSTAFDSQLAAYLNAFKVAYLTDQSSSQLVFPSFATLTNNVLMLTFPSERFQLSHSYRLTLDFSQGALVTTSRQLFQNEPSGTSHLYSMDACTCNGRGHCETTTSGRSFCRCDQGYSGGQCENCATGYHFVADACVEDVACTPSTCNGHGSCDDSDGYPQCDCNDGYANNGTLFCAGCAFGFSGYPNCVAVDEGGAESRSCTAPLLPTDLDSIAYLGFTGDLHLAERYFIDLDSGGHEMFFSLATDSAVRIYAEPHWVDIDFWLWSLNDDGSYDELINFGIAIGTEEVIYEVLPGKTDFQRQRYQLSLRYYFNEQTFETCPTFNFEFAISPLDRVKSERDAYAAQCVGASRMPQIPELTTYPPYVIPVDTGLHYHANNYVTGQLFSLVANASGNGYFYSVSFDIVPPAGQIALVHAELSHRFLSGMLSMALEEQSTDDEHQHSRPRCHFSEALCKRGSLHRNRNVLHTLVEAGRYTLWLYESVPQNTTLSLCSLFGFSLDITYVETVQDYFYCPGRRVPSCFAEPGFMLNSTGYMHIQDTYLLLEDSQTHMMLWKPSVVRLAARAPNIPLRFRIRQASNNQSVVDTNTGYNPILFKVLQAGSYYLDTFTTFVPEGSCPTMEIEISIAPLEMSFANPNCPNTEILPNLPTGLVRAPFYFHGNTSLFAFLNRRVITQWRMQIDQVSRLEVRLVSDFLTAGLHLELETSNTTHTTTFHGHQHYNLNWLSDVLFRGTYTVRVVMATAQQNVIPPPSNFPSCAEFHLNISLVPLGNPNEASCWGEPLPRTFNSLRYLGLAGRFDHQTWYQLPKFFGLTQHSISIKPTVDSVFRAYTQPHQVDIDLVLYEDQNSLPVVDGGYGLNGEESLTYILSASHTYTFTLLMWNFAFDMNHCQVVNMEFAMEPVTSYLPQRQCPMGGADNWPTPLPDTIDSRKGYYYRSAALYYQQRASDVRYWSSNFTLSVVSNFYAEIGADFPSGALVMKLTSLVDDEEYYGMNGPNGQQLRQNELKPGDYTLEIYEVAQAPTDVMSCANYTFEILIEQDTKARLINAHPYLPPSLDSLSYISLGGRMHLSGFFTMFEESEYDFVGEGFNNQTKFTVSQLSLLRCTLTHFIRVDTDSIAISLRETVSGRIYNAPLGTDSLLVESLPPGSYVLAFARINSNPFAKRQRTDYQDDSFVTWVELTLQPRTLLAQDITNHLTTPPCGAQPSIPPIQPDENGFFQFYSSDFALTDVQLRSAAVVIDSTKTSFTLLAASNIFVQVGFAFSLLDLELHLWGNRQSDGSPIDVWGRRARNMHEIDVELPPGTYRIEAVQPVLATGSFAQTTYCVPFFFKVQIQDIRNAQHVDCAAFDSLPWNLNSDNGGSAPFGGPIDSSGSLHLSGHEFLIPPGITEQKILVNVTKSSLISLMTSHPGIGSISYIVQTATTMKLIVQPVATLSMVSPAERHQIYMLAVPHNSTTTWRVYEVEVHYDNVFSSSSCSSYALQMDLQPIERVYRQLTCDSLGYNDLRSLPLPNKTANVQPDGTYAEYLHSYFPSDLFNVTGTTAFSYTVSFTLTRSTTQVVASLAYSSLVNVFELLLWKQSSTGSRLSLRQVGTTQMQARTGETTLTREVNALLEPGNYVLELRQRDRLHYAGPQPGSNVVLCLPFLWRLQILPMDGVPFVVDVDPEGEEGLSPNNDVVLDLRFSTQLYVPSGNSRVALTSANVGELLSSFSLVDSVGSVAATNARGRGSFWRLTFRAPPTGFRSKSEYRLTLSPTTRLTDSAGQQLRFLSTNVYRILDVNCNGHGTFIPDAGYCRCDDRYAGLECTVCDSNSVNTATQPGELICSPRVGGQCNVDTCGCIANIKPCSPLGKCDPNDGSCICPIGYVGDHCERCADGYVYTKTQGCTKNPNECPLCVRGYCDTNVKRCVCPDHWAGRTCDECAPGWKGINCQEPVPGAPTPAPTNQQGTSGDGGDGDEGGSSGVFTLIAIILAVVVILITIGFVIYKRFAKRRAAQYAQVDLGLEDLDADT